MVQDSRISPLESQVRECYGRVVYSHKTQEKCADDFMSRNKLVKTVQIVLSALTTCGLLAVVLTDNLVFEIVSSAISFFSLSIGLYLKEYDLGAIAQRHSDTATELWDLREQYLSLLIDMNSGGLPHEVAIARRDSLQERLKNVYNKAPRTTPEAYMKAHKGIRENEEMYFSNDELNDLLPEVLRK